MQSVEQVKQTGILELKRNVTSKKFKDVKPLERKYLGAGKALAQAAEKFALTSNPILRKASEFGAELKLSGVKINSFKGTAGNDTFTTNCQAFLYLKGPNKKRYEVGEAILTLVKEIVPGEPLKPLFAELTLISGEDTKLIIAKPVKK